MYNFPQKNSIPKCYELVTDNEFETKKSLNSHLEDQVSTMIGYIKFRI